MSRAQLGLIVDRLRRVGGAYTLIAFCIERDGLAHDDKMETV